MCRKQIQITYNDLRSSLTHQALAPKQLLMLCHHERSSMKVQTVLPASRKKIRNAYKGLPFEAMQDEAEVEALPEKSIGSTSEGG